MNLLSDLTMLKEMTARASALVALAIARDSHLTDDAVALVHAKGFSRYVKADDILASDDDAVALIPLASAFVALVDHESVLGKLAGAHHIPLAGLGRLQVGTVTTETAAEGAEKSIAQIGFTVGGWPKKVVAQIVVSDEAARALGAAVQAGLMQVLVSACAEATDGELITTLMAGGATTATTPGDLFAAVSNGSPRRPFLLGGFGALGALAPGVIRDLQALGVVVIPVAAASGSLIALDAAGLLVADDGARVSTARHATMDIDFGLRTPVTTNLWSNNLVCLRAERYLKLALRSGAAAWMSTGTPSS